MRADEKRISKMPFAGRHAGFAPEAKLRKRLREDWPGPPLIWIEHAFGGSEGAPDVMLPLRRNSLYLPVELKHWEVVGGRIVFKARPTQRRFHKLAARDGMKTAFLASLSDGRLVTMPGDLLPIDEKSDYEPEVSVVRRIEGLAEIYLDKRFWGGFPL